MTIDYNDADVAAQLKEAVKDGGLRLAFDAASENGSTDAVVDAITERDGRVVVTLPASPATADRRRDVVAVEFILVHTLMMPSAYRVGSSFEAPFLPEDHAGVLAWVRRGLPALLEGWVEGKGSPRYSGQRLRVGSGLEEIWEGLQYIRDGKASAEKLVYIIA